ncbi:MAG TPA: ribonuclease III [Stellaceae bacterium]|nr:ribonuclease III [Stellaceae bacterium]
MAAAAATESAARDDPAQTIGHAFARPALLAEALTHPSAVAPQRGKSRRRAVQRHYERLEFLGDRVLGLVIADLLWHRFEGEPEGPMTRRMADLVRRETVARVALDIGLDRHLVLSPSEAAAGAARNPGILADVCEAVIAAIYLDGGLPAAAGFVTRWWEPLIDGMAGPPRDPKTQLQEWAQARGLGLPAYRLVATEGPDHAPRFTVAASVAQSAEASATAASKRAAEAEAAAALLEQLAGAQETARG